MLIIGIEIQLPRLGALDSRKPLDLYTKCPLNILAFRKRTTVSNTSNLGALEVLEFCGDIEVDLDKCRKWSSVALALSSNEKFLLSRACLMFSRSH